MASKSEEELTLYAKITRPEGLKEAYRVVEHIQAEIKTNTGKIRVRKTTESGTATSYECVIKTPVTGADPGHDHNEETSVVIDDSFFEKFLHLSGQVIKKTRYFFKASKTILHVQKGLEIRQVSLPSLTYEVDVFHVSHTHRVGWCKIDIELDEMKTFIKQNYPNLEVDIPVEADLSKMPFMPESCFSAKGATPEQTDILNKLWGEFYVRTTPEHKESESFLFEVTDE